MDELGEVVLPHPDGREAHGGRAILLILAQVLIRGRLWSRVEVYRRISLVAADRTRAARARDKM
jgi:hypothetical protein